MWKQGGYSIADILAKVLYGLLIYKIARLKSFADDATFAATENEHDHELDRPVTTGSRSSSVVLEHQDRPATTG